MSNYTIHAGDSEIDISYAEPSVAVYNLTVNVIRMTEVSDRDGTSQEPVTIVNLMPAHIQWLSGKEKILFNKETHILDAVLHCRKPVGVTILQSDKIIYNEETYEIVDIVNVNNLNVLLRIAIRKVK